MAQCFSPFGVKDPNGQGYIPVPCGKCANCVARKVSHWSFRLMQQDKVSKTAMFVTLTYDNEHVPITKNKFMTVNKKHVQDFIKRLRYYSPKDSKIKYYAAAEYGSDTKRPHYHVILFNATSENVELAWRDKSHRPLGSCYFGTVSAASVGYSLKYISKKGEIPVHSRDDRVPEFSLKSTGLGINYLSDAMVRYHESDMNNRMYCTTEDGKKISMPRYYKDKIYTKEQRQHIGAFQASRMADELQRKIDSYGENYFRDKAEADQAANERKGYMAKKSDKI